MQSLGVSHYTIDGQPGDRVVFSCLIPVVGRQAIAQRFEAEGDDMLQAAQAALHASHYGEPHSNYHMKVL